MSEQDSSQLREGEDMSDENQSDTEQGNDQINALNEKVESLEAMNQRLMEKLEGLTTTMSQSKEAEKKMTDDDLKKLSKEDPAKYVDYLLEQKINSKYSSLESKLNTQQSKSFWDQKAQTDFPNLMKDNAFQKAVSKEISSFLQDGEMTKESPKLVYRAAQIAALKMGHNETNKSKSRQSMSAEEPTSSDAKPKTKNQKYADQFERLYSVFKHNLNPKNKDKHYEKWMKNRERLMKLRELGAR